MKSHLDPNRHHQHFQSNIPIQGISHQQHSLIKITSQNNTLSVYKLILQPNYYTIMSEQAIEILFDSQQEQKQHKTQYTNQQSQPQTQQNNKQQTTNHTNQIQNQSRQHIPSLTVNQIQIKPSNFELSQSWDTFRREDQNTTKNQEDQLATFGYSTYLKNQETYPREVYQPTNQNHKEYESEQKPKSQEKLQITINNSQSKSLSNKHSSLNVSEFQKKNEEQSRIKFQKIKSDGGEISNNSSDIDIPEADSLKNKNIRGSLNSNSSGQSLTEPTLQRRKITQFQIQKNTKSVILTCNDKTSFQKTITESYLKSLEDYFYYQLRILVPKHIPKILENPSNIEIYLNIYFRYLIKQHNSSLLVFLQKYVHKEQQKKDQQVAKQTPVTSIQTKLNNLKQMVVNTFTEGKSIVQNAVKNFYGQVPTQVRLLQRLFFKQIEMAQRHTKARQKIQNLTKIKSIHEGPYEKGEVQTKLYVLMCLNWLVGFQMTIQMLRQLISISKNQIQISTLESKLNQFLSMQEKQKKFMTMDLENRIRSIYLK